MDDPSLEEALESGKGEIKTAMASMKRVIAGLKGALIPEGINASNLGRPYQDCKDFAGRLKTLEERVQEAICLSLEHQFNIYYTGKLQKKFDKDDPLAKRAVVEEINDDLRHFRFVIKHPETGSACNLLSTSSPDGKGRYVLADRESKKRSHTSITLLDLLPLKLMPEPRRREVFAKPPKKKDGKES